MTSIGGNRSDEGCDERVVIEPEDGGCVTAECKDTCEMLEYAAASSFCEGTDQCCCNYDTNIPCLRRVPVPTGGICDDNAAGTFCSNDGFAPQTSKCLGEGSYCCNSADTSGAPSLTMTDERVQCDSRVGIPIGETCDDTRCGADCTGYASSACVWEGSCCCNN